VSDPVAGTLNRDLASWLMSHRLEIERIMGERLGAAAPTASGPEAETLRRFRTFTASALMRGEAPRPVLDGLRPNERRVMALLGCWVESAGVLAGPDARAVSAALAPLLDAFRLAIRTTGAGRKSSGRPRVSRRAVTAAIDRVADLYFAIDVDSGEIVDANPAAGAALGVARDALIDIELGRFVPDDDQGPWWTSLDALAEGQESVTFEASLQDREARRLRLEISATRHLMRQRTLALVLARPATRIERLRQTPTETRPETPSETLRPASPARTRAVAPTPRPPPPADGRPGGCG
jgi:PAS domain-containing protein